MACCTRDGVPVNDNAASLGRWYSCGTTHKGLIDYLVISSIAQGAVSKVECYCL